MRAFVEIRSQSPRGTWPKSGPDMYAVVQVVPSGVKRLIALHRKAARKRGIQLIWCGEGYRERQKTQSGMYRQAIDKANELANVLNRAFELGYTG